MGMDAGICRQMVRGRCLIRAPEFLWLDDAVGDAEAPAGFGIVEVADTHQAFSEALDELSGPFVSRTQRERCFHSRVTGHCAWR